MRRLVATVGGVAALGMVIGWWLFVSQDDSGLRHGLLGHISLIIDRLDQLSDAWQNRSVPTANERSKTNPLGAKDRGANAPRGAEPSTLASSGKPAGPTAAPPAPDKIQLQDPGPLPGRGEEAAPAEPPLDEAPKSQISARDQRKLERELKARLAREEKSHPAPEVEKPEAAPAPDHASEVSDSDQEQLNDLFKNIE